MILKKKILRPWGLAFLLVGLATTLSQVALTGCSHPALQKQKSALESPLLETTGSQEQEFWSHRKKLVKEADLFNALSPMLSPTTDQFEVFQLVCESAPSPQTTVSCSYLKTPVTSASLAKQGQKSIKLPAKNAVKLFNLLINLPLNKGETGVSTDYLSCRRFRDSDKTPWTYYCTVAAPVGLIPHTSMPIPELPDEP